MTSPSTTETTSASTTTRRTAGRALAVAAVVVGVGLAVGAPVGAGLGDPVDPRDPEEETSTTDAATSTKPDGLGSSTAPATSPTTEGTATTQPSDDGATATDGEEVADTDDDGGTSVASLAAVGIVAFVLGLIVAAIPLGAALSRRKAAPTAAPLGPAPGPVPPAPATPPPAGGIAIGPAPSRDTDQVRQQRTALAEALIGLRDQLPSEALSAQAAGALAAAGVAELAPVGQAFDPAQHKAVHQVPTDDPAQHNVITSVERPGYADGTQVLRLPEVVVARHGGGS